MKLFTVQVTKNEMEGNVYKVCNTLSCHLFGKTTRENIPSIL